MGAGDPALWSDLYDEILDLLVLPDDVNATASSSTVTSTTFANLPNNLAAAITNPRADLDMVVDAVVSAWMASNGTVELTATIALSGGMTVAAGSAVLANGELMLEVGTTATDHQKTIPFTIPAGAAAVTVTVQARRNSASGTQIFNVPVLRLRPRRYQIP
jgi:hypothetical protein